MNQLTIDARRFVDELNAIGLALVMYSQGITLEDIQCYLMVTMAPFNEECNLIYGKKEFEEATTLATEERRKLDTIAARFYQDVLEMSKNDEVSEEEVMEYFAPRREALVKNNGIRFRRILSEAIYKHKSNNETTNML